MGALSGHFCHISSFSRVIITTITKNIMRVLVATFALCAFAVSSAWADCKADCNGQCDMGQQLCALNPLASGFCPKAKVACGHVCEGGCKCLDECQAKCAVPEGGDLLAQGKGLFCKVSCNMACGLQITTTTTTESIQAFFGSFGSLLEPYQAVLAPLAQMLGPLAQFFPGLVPAKGAAPAAAAAA